MTATVTTPVATSKRSLYTVAKPAAPITRPQTSFLTILLRALSAFCV
jgi:hypothetical protein